MTGFAAGLVPNVLSGFCVGLVMLRGPGNGNRCYCLGLVGQVDVRVLHLHADVAVVG